MISHTRGGTICYGHWVLRLVIKHTRQGVRLKTGLGSASRDIIHETQGTICYRHLVLRLVISHTRHRVRFVNGIWFDLLCDITHETEVRARTQVPRGTICCWCLGLELSTIYCRCLGLELVPK